MAGTNDRDNAGRGAPLDETLEAPSGPSAPARADLPSEAPLLDREGRRRLIESPERDLPVLAAVDPDHYVYGYELARGGMGRIVAARDRRLGRVVAIKELIQDTPERAARFEREALITARLQHPAIVNLHEAGHWPSGQPFYAMKLVAGRSLSEVASETRPLPERLALLPSLIAMVEALAYAHRQRIIHRDLKPSNVLIGELGETVVIDWGLAKDLAAEPGDRTHLPGGTDDTLDARAAGFARAGSNGPGERRAGGRASSTGSLTLAGSVMGTPGYMPPEQAAGKEVDERADVYALGAILYHLLGGAEPYRGASSDAILAAVLAGPPAPLAAVEPRLAQDLVTIVEKAMATDPAARYPTAVQLAEDLRRFQTGKLVGAHRYSRRALVWRFAVRHRAAAVATLAALVTIAAVAMVSFRRVLAERDRAEAASVAAARRADELAVAQAGSIIAEDPRGALDLLSRLSPGASPSIWRTARMVASDARLRGLPEDLRGHEAPITHFDLSSDGKVLVSVDLHALRVWDLPGRRGRVLGRQGALIQRVALSPDKRRAVTVGLDNRLRLWALDSGAVTEIGGHEGVVSGLRFLDAGRVASTAADGTLRVWQLDGGEPEVIRAHQGHVFDLDVSDDGALMATAGEDGMVRVWRPGQKAPVRELRPTPGGIHRVALSADGARVAGVGAPREVWLWEVASGRGRRLAGHDKDVLAVDFSADGRRLATAGKDRTIRLWDVASGESEVLREHQDAVDLLAFARGSDLLLSWAQDGTVRVWMVSETSASVVQELGGHDRGKMMEVSADGGVVVTGGGTLLRRWQIGAASSALRGHRAPVTQVEFAPGAGLVSGSADWTVRVWPEDRAPRVLRGHEAGIMSLAVSSDGRFAASADLHRFVMLWDLARGSGRRLSGRAHGQPRFSPGGGLLAVPTTDHAVRLWSTATGEARLLRGHTSWVTSVAFSPDGRHLASASADRSVRLWEFATGKSRALEGHGAAVRLIEFAGSGRVVSSDVAGVIREWEV
ncbi:MAG TPA: protein kinase, partial [Kofleriaceae bacterium]|nr:protein kinase [Kofleriaceae bacterium]